MDRWTLTFGRIDNLSTIFAFIMALMAIIGTIYGLHVEDEWQHIAAWFYVAGSLGVIYSGDYLVLFLFWEMMAFASTFLIWFNSDKDALARRLPLPPRPHLRRGNAALRLRPPLPGNRGSRLQPAR